MEKKQTKKIGYLLSSIDELHLFYYKSKDAVKSCPSRLLGSLLLPFILEYPSRAIIKIEKRSKPFLDVINKIANNKEMNKIVGKARYIKSKFSKDFKEVKDIIGKSEVKQFSLSEKNNIMLNYLNFRKEV